MIKKRAFILPTTLGNSGGVKMVFIYAQKLNELGYYSEVIYPIIPSNIELYKLKDIKLCVKFLGTIILNLLNYNRLKYNKKFNKVKIRKVINLNNLEKYQIDSYIATAWDTYYYVKKTTKEKMYFVQSYETWSGPKELVENTYKDNEFRYITITNQLKNRLKEDFNVNSYCIYNPIDFEVLDCFKNYKKIYGIIYRHESNKNFKLTIEFLMKNKNFRNRFYLLGRNIPNKYKKLFERVYDGREQEHVRQFYKDINIFIFPSNNEGFGLPILEAIFYKNVVISKKVGILNDFVDIKYITLDKYDYNGDLRYEILEEVIIESDKITQCEYGSITDENIKFAKMYYANVNIDKNCEKFI